MSIRSTLTIGLTLAVAITGFLIYAISSSDPPSPGEANPANVYDPVAAGETLPLGFRSLLDRDQIEPVYHPEFTSADGVDWPEDSLVIGVAGTQTAKAYPVTHLNSHEMVLDSLDDDPILVSW
jgi:hypothetical protein